MIKRNIKYLLALLVPFLLHAVIAWPLAAAMIEYTGEVSPKPGASPWDAKGELYVGYTKTGELSIADGGTISSSGTNVLGYWEGSSGTVTVDGKGSTWTTTGNSSSSFFAVGLLGDGKMTITNGGAVYCEGLGPGYYYNHSYVGSEAGSTSSVLVDGKGSTWGNSGNLYVGNVGNGTLTISDGGTVYNQHGIVGHFYTKSDDVLTHGVGVVTVDGAGSTWTNNGTLTVGSTGEGTVNITNGGAVFSVNGSLGNQVSSLTGLRGQGAVLVDGKGSTWTVSNALTIGTSGDGVLVISNGGAVSNVDGFIAKSDGSTGVVMVDGKDSTWTNSGMLTIGRQGDGTLTITDGGSVSNTNGIISEFWLSTGTVTVSGKDSTWTNTGYLSVGDSGTGMLNIAGGGTVSNASGYIGYNHGAIGGVMVDGDDSTWANSGSLYVGVYGSGELAITNGGLVSSTNGIIAYGADATGVVVVDGKDSTWTNSGYLSVGDGGDGTLIITNGGTVSNSTAYIGSGDDAVGRVAVDGQGSTWITDGALYVGESGSGVLTITDGAKVSSIDAYMGAYAFGTTATGTVIVDGPGSTWDNDGILYVGLMGRGELAITNGGQVNSVDSYMGASGPDSIGIAIVDGPGSAWTNSNELEIGNGVLTIRNGGVVTADYATYMGFADHSAIIIGAAGDETAVAPGTLDTPHIVFGDGTSHIIFKHTDVTGNYTFSPIIVNGVDWDDNVMVPGKGSAIALYSGTTVFTGVGSNYSAPTIIFGGTLAAGAADVFSRNSDYDIYSAGTMDLRGHSQHVGSLTNAGLITMGTGTAPGTTLTVHGDYVGNGGTIVMNTKLGNDASPSDRLIIDGGNASGSTFLDIVNAKGLGAQTKGNGILLVDTVNDGTTDAGAFTLKKTVKAGAFEYTLYRGGVDDDEGSDEWYLRSGSTGSPVNPDNPDPTRPEVPGIVVASTLAPQMGRVMVGTLFTRTGNYYGYGMGRDNATAGRSGMQPSTQPSRDSKHDHMLWSRVFGETGRNGGGGGNGNFGFGRNGPAYTFTYGGVQLGADLFRGEKDVLGLYLGATELHSRVKTASGRFAGTVDMDTLNVAGYWTHYDPSGWYTDLVLQGDWYADIRSHSAHGEKFSTHGWGLTASAETGYAIDFLEGAKKFSMIPQAQVIYQYTDIQDSSDKYGRIHYGQTNAFYGRLGDRLSKTWSSGVSTWAEANLWHQFGSDAKTTFRALDGSHPTTISARLGGTWAQAVLGVSVPITKHVKVFGAMDYNIGISHSSQSVGGQVGVQISW